MNFSQDNNSIAERPDHLLDPPSRQKTVHHPFTLRNYPSDDDEEYHEVKEYDPRKAMEMRHEAIAQKRQEREKNKQMRKKLDENVKRLEEKEQKEKQAREEEEKQRLQKEVKEARNQVKREVNQLKLNLNNNNNNNDNNNNNKFEHDKLEMIQLNKKRKLNSKRVTPRKQDQKQINASKEKQELQSKFNAMVYQRIRMRKLKRHIKGWRSMARKTQETESKIKVRRHWKILNRLFSLWQKNYFDKKDSKDNQQWLQDMQYYRKIEKTADSFVKKKMSSRYFLKWKASYQIICERHSLDRKHDNRKAKLEGFLSKLKQSPRPSYDTDQFNTENNEASSKNSNSETKTQYNISATTSKTQKDSKNKTVSKKKSVTTETKKSIENQEDESKLKKMEAPKTPNFVVAMEERSKERKRKREELKRRQEEARREREEKMREEEKRKMEEEIAQREEEIQQRKKEWQERQRIERERRIRKEKEQKRQEEMNNKMQEVRMRIYVLNPWLNLMEMKKEKEQRADEYRKHVLVSQYIKLWQQFVQQIQMQRQEQIEYATERLESWYGKICVANAFSRWNVVLQQQQRKLNEADQFHQNYQNRQILNSWFNYATHQARLRALSELEKERKANEFFTQWMKRRIIIQWQYFLQEQAEQREIEEFQNDLWQRSRQWQQQYQRENHKPNFYDYLPNTYKAEEIKNF